MTGRVIVSIVLLLIAIALFLVVAFNWTPTNWTVNLGWLGLAFFAGSVLPRIWPAT